MREMTATETATAEKTAAETIFRSFLMGGFECSTHRRHDGRRLDLIESTRHEEFAVEDYARLADVGMNTARDGVRWHLIEPAPHRYEFASLERQVNAMNATGVEVIWDLFHYGYPDDLDIFAPAFVDRFARFAAAAARFLRDRTSGTLFLCPVNEISFFSWIAGEKGVFHPYERRRGDELKTQLVRASIAATDAIREAVDDVRFVHTDPAIHVTTRKPERRRQADAYRRAQFQAFDMLAGRRRPELGGRERYLDIIGLNYYFHNQWFYPNRRKIPRGHSLYRPLRDILAEYAKRYERPLFIAETGIEEDERASWFDYVTREANESLALGVPLHGICLYPIVNHPGWADDRHCRNGLWCYADDDGKREPHGPLLSRILDFEDSGRVYRQERL